MFFHFIENVSISFVLFDLEMSSGTQTLQTPRADALRPLHISHQSSALINAQHYLYMTHKQKLHVCTVEYVRDR